MGEIADCRIQLRWEIITFRLAFAAHKPGLLVALMKMMHYRAGVVEELAVDRPAMVGVPHGFADHTWPLCIDGLFECEELALRNDIAEPFIGRPVVVHGRRCGSKPAFVDSSAMCAKGIQIA